MKKGTVQGGFAMFAFGLVIWIVGRLMGVTAVLMPLLVIVGLITMVAGLFQEGE